MASEIAKGLAGKMKKELGDMDHSVAKLESSGPFSFGNKAVKRGKRIVIPANMFRAAHFLTIWDWEVCIPTKGDKPRVMLRETRTLSGVDLLGKQVNEKTYRPDRKNGQQAWEEAYSQTIADRKAPLGECDQTLIYADAPGFYAVIGALGKAAGFLESFTLKVEQELEVISARKTIAKLEWSHTISMDKNGNINATP